MDRNADLLVKIQKILGGLGTRASRAEKLAEQIRRAGRYRWVGLYDIEEAEIAVLGWSGAGEPAHPRFPRTQGLCGSAALQGVPVVVHDVREDPRYLTTFGSTLSEIVVPVKQPGSDTVVGLIDVESDRVHAFSSDDQEFLEACAQALAELWQPAEPRS